MEVFTISINLLFGIICFFSLGGGNSSVAFAAEEVAATPNADVQPNQIYSKDGILDAILNVDYLLSLDGTRYAPAYNGKPVGPTFRVKPGDTIKIKLINNLLPESDTGRELYEYVSNPNPVDSMNQTSKQVIYLTPNMHRIIGYIKCTHTIESVLFNSLSLSLFHSFNF
jgi:FtsP/CotA-like multicopper oxidase with cupredoxin domain